MTTGRRLHLGASIRSNRAVLGWQTVTVAALFVNLVAVDLGQLVLLRVWFRGAALTLDSLWIKCFCFFLLVELVSLDFFLFVCFYSSHILLD